MSAPSVAARGSDHRGDDERQGTGSTPRGDLRRDRRQPGGGGRGIRPYDGCDPAGVSRPTDDKVLGFPTVALDSKRTVQDGSETSLVVSRCTSVVLALAAIWLHVDVKPIAACRTKRSAQGGRARARGS